MSQLDNFMAVLTGRFDNTEQYEQFKRKGVEDFPLAEHVNTACNEKILHLPEGFQGTFMVEESYYTVGKKTHASPHLFLFTQEPEGIKLTSYDIPQGYDKATFSYDKMGQVEFETLQRSEKFTPAIYVQKGEVWEGGSISMFSPVLKFTLFERFSPRLLEVSETMELNGRRTFGYDEPILYKRKQDQSPLNG